MEGEDQKKGKAAYLVFFFLLLGLALFSPGKTPAAEVGGPPGALTEQEAAAEKFLSSLESALAHKFFHYRNRPVVRVAVFDFTDEAGNVVKGGQAWADKISRRLYPQSQFEVVNQEKVSRYTGWSDLGSISKVDALGLRTLQRRINTLDPGNGIHALIVGEVKKGAGRSLMVQASLVNFQFKVGQMELEKNLVDVLPLAAEIPVPTEQLLREALEIVSRGGKEALSEGRLVILANTRGYPLVETEYGKQFSKDQPFPWNKIPFVFAVGKEESTMPKQVQIGLDQIPLSPRQPQPNSRQRLEYSFLHGKCATNEIYFDGMIPAMNYRVLASFMDLKNNQIYSNASEVQVYPGTTTVVILSIYVPSEKQRFQSQQTPRIDVFQLFGKDLEILPKG